MKYDETITQSQLDETEWGGVCKEEPRRQGSRQGSCRTPRPLVFRRFGTNDARFGTNVGRVVEQPPPRLAGSVRITVFCSAIVTDVTVHCHTAGALLSQTAENNCPYHRVVGF